MLRTFHTSAFVAFVFVLLFYPWSFCIPDVGQGKLRRSNRVRRCAEDWSNLKEMNRDLQPKGRKKNPVAEVTPQKKRCVILLTRLARDLHLNYFALKCFSETAQFLFFRTA